MKIKYTQKRLNYNLILALIWLLIGSIFILNGSDRILNYGFFVVGALYLGLYLYNKNNQYVTIENDEITQHNLLPKSIKIKDIKSIHEVAGDYIIKSRNDSKLMKINTHIIDKDSQLALKNFFNELNYQKPE